MRYYISIIVVMALALAVVGCSSASPAPSAAPTPPTPPASSPPPPSTLTFGQLADAGASVFASKCTTCHGSNGQGVTAPAVIGADANLDKYNTAQGLLNFISVSMPFNAPGSLSSQEYSNLLGFLLVRNNYVPASTTFDPGQLSNIQLKK